MKDVMQNAAKNTGDPAIAEGIHDLAVAAKRVLNFALVLLAALIVLVMECAMRVQQLGPVITDVNRNVVIIAGAATNLEKSLRAERDASKAQAEASTAILLKLNIVALRAVKTIGDLDQLVKSTDQNLNGQVLPGIAGAIGANDKRLEEIELSVNESVHTFTHDTEQLLAQTTVVMQNAAKNTGDPAIAEGIHDLAVAAKHVNAISANGEVASDKALVAFENYLKPPKLIITILDRIIGPVAEVATAIYTSRSPVTVKPAANLKGAGGKKNGE